MDAQGTQRADWNSIKENKKKEGGHDLDRSNQIEWY
jgi:hypothetical protein